MMHLLTRFSNWRKKYKMQKGKKKRLDSVFYCMKFSCVCWGFYDVSNGYKLMMYLPPYKSLVYTLF